MFSSRLRTIRKEKNLSQKQLANLLNVAESTVSMYENGKREPSFDTVNLIAEKLGVKVGFLLGEDKINEEENSIIDFKPSKRHEEDIDDNGIEAPIIDFRGHSITRDKSSDNGGKDERDIAKKMEQIKKDLTKGDGLSFHGEPMSEEAIESLLEAMEYAVRQTQRINKKYIPKKYRKEDNN